MLGKLAAIALNTYRENVRARLLHGLFALAIATVGYSMIVGAYAFKDTLRVVSDLGGASISIYGIVVAVVLGATSLHRELELKTAFPILARPVSRTAYLIAKFLGSFLSIFVFTTGNCSLLLVAVAVLGGASETWVFGSLGLLSGGTGFLAWKYPRSRTYLPILVAVIGVFVGFWLAGVAPDDRRVVVGTTALALLEVGIVIAIANLFAAFSSPFLTAMLTVGCVVVGRSADTLGRLPERVFGHAIAEGAQFIAKIVPNLMTYVPARPLLTGEMSGIHLPTYFGRASFMALGWIIVLLTLSSVLFARRDFT